MRQGTQGQHTGMTLRDGIGREVGEGFRMEDTCTPMLIAALFTIASIWKQPPLTDEWIRKLWCVYTREYYSAIKKNAFELILMR